MTRNDFPAIAAAAIVTATGLPVTADHVDGLALELWDAAQRNACDEAQFRAALIAGVAALADALARMVDHEPNAVAGCVAIAEGRLPSREQRERAQACGLADYNRWDGWTLTAAGRALTGLA